MEPLHYRIKIRSSDNDHDNSPTTTTTTTTKTPDVFISFVSDVNDDMINRTDVDTTQ